MKASRSAWILATWFGSGFVPKAPGTAGAVVAVPIGILADRAGRWGVAAAAVGVTAAGLWASSQIARELGAEDPQVIVIDEVAGMLVSMACMRRMTWRKIALAFLLFRTLDALKPWPISWCERWRGGLGVMLDDIAAGAATAGILAALEASGRLG
ncbi:MAG: phosphatidylglycerophosphatase A [Polyangiaceae bacterium]|jgi:phosphatidylglycerophosphatase A